MKVSAKFFLSGVFVLLSAITVQPIFAQTWSQYIALEGRVSVLEMKLQDQQNDIQTLAKSQDALLEALKNARFDIDFLKSMRGFADTKTEDNSKKLNTVESKLYETDEKLTKAEETIELLDLRLSAFEPRARKPKAPARHSKAAASKPAPTAK